MRFLHFVCLFVLTNGLFGQVAFQPTVFTDGPFGTDQNCAVDMNGDYLDDIVALNQNRLQIFYQQPQGGFSSRVFPLDLTHRPDWSICAGDIDGNGYNDLAIGGQAGVSFLYANENGSIYTEDAKPDYIFSQRTSFADINNDGHLDAFICHDENENQPFRNDGTGQLTLDYNLLKTPSGVPGNYTVTWVDYDNDNDLDLHIAKCVQGAPPSAASRVNLLYNNDGQSNYTEVGAEANLDDGDQSWITLFEDYDNDGDFDAITFNHESRNRFMVNNGEGQFSDASGNVGIPSGALGAFEALAADFDNDGNMDIITDQPPVIYYGNGDFTFTVETSITPASALADLNSDGFVDVVASNLVFYNQGNSNHWLRVNTIGTTSNRNGLGARLELYGAWGMQIREVRATQSWSPMSTLSTHFGIGQATSIDSLVVKWPSGNRTVVVDPQIDQAVFVNESDCPYRTIALEVDTKPILCEDELATLTAPAGFETYKWSNGEETATIEVGEKGVYNVTVTDANQCSSFTDSEEIFHVNGTYEISTPEGTEFCEGGNVFLELDVPFDVTWSDGSTGNSLFVTESGLYTASIVTDCDTEPSIQPVEVTEFVLDPLELEEVVLDTSQSILFVSVSDQPNAVPGAQYLWYSQPIDGVPFIGNTLFFSELNTDTTFYISYFLPVGDNLFCFSERAPFTIRPLGAENRIIANTDPYLCEGEEIVLTAPSGYTYLWSNNDTSRSITVMESGSYAVTITDADGEVEILESFEVFVEQVEPLTLEDIYVDASTSVITISIGQLGLVWWDAAAGGNLLYTGDDLEHFVLESEYTYYIERQVEQPNGGICLSERVPLTIYRTSSTDDLQGADLSIYPNPTTGNCMVEYEKGHLLHLIKVIDPTGKTVQTINDGFSNKMQLSLEGLPSSLYFVEFHFKDHQLRRSVVLVE